MADLLAFPAERTRPHGFRSKLSGGDELASIGNPELLLSNALSQIRAAAVLLFAIKPGEDGERDAINEIFSVFRGPDWAAMIQGCQDDGA